MSFKSSDIPEAPALLINNPRLPLLLTAEVYISMSKPAEAAACTQEASNLFPTSHNVLYMRGQIAELRGNMDEAKRWYEEALSINPTHVKSMQRLVRTHPARPFPTVSFRYVSTARASKTRPIKLVYSQLG